MGGVDSSIPILGSQRLSQLEKPPEEIFHIGAPLDSLNLTHSCGIVGSRKVSQEGIDLAHMLGKQTALDGNIVISGLAKGIDTAAFEGALEVGGICIAVLPSGVDIITPASNRELAAQIIENGGSIISEQPLGTKPMNHTYILRNRLIAALSETIVLGEAKDEGGAWHTIRAAWKLKRSVYRLDLSGDLIPLSNPQRGLYDEEVDE